MPLEALGPLGASAALAADAGVAGTVVSLEQFQQGNEVQVAVLHPPAQVCADGGLQHSRDSPCPGRVGVRQLGCAQAYVAGTDLDSRPPSGALSVWLRDGLGCPRLHSVVYGLLEGRVGVNGLAELLCRDAVPHG